MGLIRYGEDPNRIGQWTTIDDTLTSDYVTTFVSFKYDDKIAILRSTRLDNYQYKWYLYGPNTTKELLDIPQMNVSNYPTFTINCDNILYVSHGYDDVQDYDMSDWLQLPDGQWVSEATYNLCLQAPARNICVGKSILDNKMRIYCVESSPNDNIRKYLGYIDTDYIVESVEEEK